MVDSKLDNLRKKKTADPEATALKKARPDLVELLQGSIVQFATKANGKKLLSDEEKNAAFPHSQHNVHYTSILLQEVIKGVKTDEENFDVFLDMIRDLGGPLISLSKKLSKIR